MGFEQSATHILPLRHRHVSCTDTGEYWLCISQLCPVACRNTSQNGYAALIRVTWNGASSPRVCAEA